jgi:hypothetical protein
MANGTRAAAILAFITLGSSVSRAEEVNIGHLEATDDSGIDWQHYSCESRNHVLHCHIFQTLINHEIDPPYREKKIAEKLSGTTVESFKAEMGETCRNASAIRAKIDASLAVGKKANGQPYSKQETTDMRASFANLEAVCKNTSPENLRRLVELDVDKSIRTCVIQNQHFEDTFSWNARMKAWESRSKELGPCGSITETRLTHDPASPALWLSEERHMYVRRNGVLPDGRSCSIIPTDRTYHFTWRAADNAVECTYIKNNMVD